VDKKRQLASGTLEACHPSWPCCWSNATAPTGYPRLMIICTITTGRGHQSCRHPFWCLLAFATVLCGPAIHSSYTKMYINSIYNKFLVPPQQQVVTTLLYNSVKDICITNLQFVPGSHVVQFTDPRIGAEEPSGHGKHCVEA